MHLPRHRAISAVAALFAVLCLTTVSLMPHGAHWSPDSSAKFLAVRAIRIEGGTLRYDVPYLGRNYDPALIAVPLGETYFDIRNGEVRISWPELFPLLVAPFYRLFGWLGLFVVPMIGGIVSVYLAGKIAESIRSRTGWIAATILIFTTPLLIYSTQLWEHTPALALLMTALWLSLQFLTDRTMWKIALAAACVGLASAGLRTDTNVFFAALMGALFFMLPGRRRWTFQPVAIVGFVVGAAPASALNWITNGKILAANTMKNTPPPSLTYLKKVGIGILPHFFAGIMVPPRDAWLVLGGIAVLAAAHYFLRGRARTSVLLLSMLTIASGSALALIDTRARDIDRFHGFIVMSPLLALALLATSKRVRFRAGARLVLLTSTLLCALNMAALSVAFPEGWSSDFNREWGPRYWLVIFPMLAILVAVNYDAMFVNARSGLEKAAIAFGVLVLSGVGIAFQLTGLGFIYKTTGDLAEVPAIMEQQGDTPLLADFFLTSSESPDQFFRRPSFYVPTYLPGEFRTWLTEVVSHGLVKFDFATAMPDPTQHVFFKTPLDPGYSLVVDGVSRGSYLAIAHVRVIHDDAAAPH